MTKKQMDKKHDSLLYWLKSNELEAKEGKNSRKYKHMLKSFKNVINKMDLDIDDYNIYIPKN